MKTLLLLALSLFAITTVAQEQQPETSKAAADSSAKAKSDDLSSLTAPVKTCAYIHSFIFEREDGEAPKLVKETYCTPTGSFAVHRAFKPGLYPAVMAPKKADPKASSQAPAQKTEPKPLLQ